MKDFIRNNGILLLVIAVLSAAILAVFSSFGGGLADPLSNLMGIVAAPARSVATRFFNWTESVYNYAFQYEELEQENAELKKQIAEMEQKAIAGETATRENALLRELLGLQEKRSEFVFDMASVTSRSVHNWESSLTISKGSIHDISAGDCVIDETGALIGIIEEVGTTWSTVRTIIDPDTEIGALVVRTDSVCIAGGDFALMGDGQLKLSFLPENAQLIAGDLVLTSSLNGIYPSGLIIGSITQLDTEVSGMGRYAILEPRAALEEVKQVFIIKEFHIVE